MKLLKYIFLAKATLAAYQQMCKPQYGTVNCRVFCDYCSSYSTVHGMGTDNKLLKTIVEQSKPELNCNIPEQIEACDCKLVQSCQKLTKLGDWKSGMTEEDTQKGRTLVLLDESASISEKSNIGWRSNQHSGLLKNYIIHNFNNWKEKLGKTPVDGEKYIHDKLTVMMFNEDFRILHTNKKETAKDLSALCNYYPERNTAFRDALGCAFHMYENECNVKVIVFTDGEENKSQLLTQTDENTNQLVNMVQNKIKNRGWEVNFISTLSKDDILQHAETDRVLPTVYKLAPTILSQSKILPMSRNQATIKAWLKADESYKEDQKSDNPIGLKQPPSVFDTELWENHDVWTIQDQEGNDVQLVDREANELLYKTIDNDGWIEVGEKKIMKQFQFHD